MNISDKGLAALIAEEGEVLRAYRDVAGVWTIGAGLTAASGVVKPVAGMTITREQSRAHLREAIERNYAPAVRKRLGDQPQHVFDAALSFHFNTGAIGRATWVTRYLQGDLVAAEAAFKTWNRAGGRVVKGLTDRRAREWAMLAHGRYPASSSTTKIAIASAAAIVAPSSAAAIDWRLGVVVLIAAATGIAIWRWRKTRSG
ncbi:lysozyme RrrD [Variibacter gotjawalensis]|uniref:Lysozyme n=1 Tax=Variibacter gotjawalensis TaxID=1333996 RepID=A0A0S3PZQ8_9BRAD|nr:lysozyme [Variibacter gotjawalensis]NIK47053.1 GH24 family phage-related lysozyme (muramidase) [Variibacter gotjawalensis]RZS48958.1 GH24 family phage-related lysozyme (muramidase) [Variibacter gotjawalensis]BAT61216.1 lysozyme RrrD [Variibacter gotjawalensis]